MRLGEPWVIGSVITEMVTVGALTIALWIHSRRRGHLKRTTAAHITAPSFCGGRTGRFALVVWRLANLIWFSGYALADWSGCNSAGAEAASGPLAAHVDRAWGDCDLSDPYEAPGEYPHWNFRLQALYWMVVLLTTAYSVCSCGKSRPKVML